MRLAYLIELVLVLAVGIGLARWVVGSEVTDGAPNPETKWAPWLDRVGGGFLTGVALTGLVGLAIEVARGQTPRPWGLGRWAWAVVGLLLAARLSLELLVDATLRLAGRLGRFSSVSEVLAELSHDLLVTIEVTPIHHLGYLMVALVATRRLACVPSSGADPREWAGRAFAAFAGALSLATIVAWKCEYSLFKS